MIYIYIRTGNMNLRSIHNAGAWLLIITILILTTVQVIGEPVFDALDHIYESTDAFLLSAGHYGIAIPTAAGNGDRLHPGLHTITIAADIPPFDYTLSHKYRVECTSSEYELGLYILNLNLRI
jgi:hypothetical protein